MKKETVAYFEVYKTGPQTFAETSGKKYCLTGVMFHFGNFKPELGRAIMEILNARQILFWEENEYWKGEPDYVIFRNHVDDEIGFELNVNEARVSIYSKKPDVYKRYLARFKKISAMLECNNSHQIWVPIVTFLTENDRNISQGIAVPSKYEKSVPLDNYSGSTRDEITSLEAILDEKEYFGRIIILHGPPGTGKSFYIRRLISKLYQGKNNDGIYFFMGRGIHCMELSHCLGKNILISEDADAILSSKQGGDDYREFASKILNFSSGFIQTKGLFVFTSNLDAMDINPAFLRDGRLLAYIKFGTFSQEEGEAWLGQHGCQAKLSMDSQEYTLANLYAIRNDFKKIESKQVSEPSIGFLAHCK